MFYKVINGINEGRVFLAKIVDEKNNLIVCSQGKSYGFEEVKELTQEEEELSIVKKQINFN